MRNSTGRPDAKRNDDMKMTRAGIILITLLLAMGGAIWWTGVWKLVAQKRVYSVYVIWGNERRRKIVYWRWDEVHTTTLVDGYRRALSVEEYNVGTGKCVTNGHFDRIVKYNPDGAVYSVRFQDPQLVQTRPPWPEGVMDMSSAEIPAWLHDDDIFNDDLYKQISYSKEKRLVCNVLGSVREYLSIQEFNEVMKLNGQDQHKGAMEYLHRKISWKDAVLSASANYNIRAALTHLGMPKTTWELLK